MGTASAVLTLLPLLPRRALVASSSPGRTRALLSSGGVSSSVSGLRPRFPPLSHRPRRCNLYCRRGMPLGRKVTGKSLCSQVELEDDVDDEACELVNGVELVIGEGEDSFRAYLLKAVKNNNGTGVLLLSDALGFEDSATRDFAYRVACYGYNVLVPDLFRANPWKLNWAVDGFDSWLSKQSPERVARDVDACTAWMIDEFLAAGISKKLGVIGFSFGGGHLMEALSRDEQAYYGTGICFYGSNMDPSKGSSIKTPVLFVSGDNDPSCPVTTLNEIEKKIQGSRVVIYHGRGQGFVHRPESEEEDEAAEDAFSIMRNWLHDNLLVRETELLV
ncbi:carboxymethylenebutenolidase homolog isoform X1 [Zingiber officinale]|uniref:carboxymethylenebutenolidase homolog isoform X1 n=1 Tax=Zingiber officinale TaxID=94328 RepID=UPI001C4CF0B0|nr:carboxymethylenebutenolidase homolog isoform X1 [Zingiber officinale]